MPEWEPNPSDLARQCDDYYENLLLPHSIIPDVPEGAREWTPEERKFFMGRFVQKVIRDVSEGRKVDMRLLSDRTSYSTLFRCFVRGQSVEFAAPLATRLFHQNPELFGSSLANFLHPLPASHTEQFAPESSAQKKASIKETIASKKYFIAALLACLLSGAAVEYAIDTLTHEKREQDRSRERPRTKSDITKTEERFYDEQLSYAKAHPQEYAYLVAMRTSFNDALNYVLQTRNPDPFLAADRYCRCGDLERLLGNSEQARMDYQNALKHVKGHSKAMEGLRRMRTN